MKIIIELDLKHNRIMSFSDIKYEVKECLEKLKYRHLISKTIAIKLKID